MKRIILLCWLTFLLTAAEYTFMYWNLENLFDLKDNILKKDDDYLPQSRKRFTYRAQLLKLEHLARVINYVNPDILAFVEVENHIVLKQLQSLLRHPDSWEIIISDGPDIRGIDPAVMYRCDYFILQSTKYYPVFFPEDNYHSRDIMQVILRETFADGEFSLFVNHWPSRRGGKTESSPRRLYAASCLQKALATEKLDHSERLLLVTGDFNDDRQDSSLQYLIKQNGMYYIEKDMPENIYGTYCYKGNWISFDHFLTDSREKMNYFHSAKIVCPFWTRDSETQGPFRFYKGTKIIGGYSDHFPIRIDIEL